MDPLLTRDQAAELLGCSERLVRKLIASEECVEPGCWRPPYIDERCKMHHDIEHYRQERRRERDRGRVDRVTVVTAYVVGEPGGWFVVRCSVCRVLEGTWRYQADARDAARDHLDSAHPHHNRRIRLIGREGHDAASDSAGAAAARRQMPVIVDPPMPERVGT